MAIAIQKSLNTLRHFHIQSIFYRNIRMSANLRAEEAIDVLKKTNPYYEKYATKIAALQQTSPEEFLNRLESVERKSPPKKTEKDR